MKTFSFQVPAKTILGRGVRAQAGAEIASHGSRALIIRGRSVPWADCLLDDLKRQGMSAEEVFLRREPTLEDVLSAVTLARDFAADCVVSIGGGSVIDLGKAVSGLAPSPGAPEDYILKSATLAPPLPFIAIPTTAGTGAEATKNAVITISDQRKKVSLRDPRLVPDVAIIDPILTDHAPKGLTLASGLDAVVQLIECYLSCRASPLTDALCRGSIPSAVMALQSLMEQETEAARDEMARASYLSGVALANAGLGIVHGLASVIGGWSGAHGAICGRLLPAALAVNRKAAESRSLSVARIEDVERFLGVGLGQGGSAPLRSLLTFIDQNRLATLEELGVPRSTFGAVASEALTASSSKANGIELDIAEITEILETTARYP